MNVFRLPMTSATALTIAAAVMLAADVAEADDNDDLLIGIAALIGAHNAALPVSFVPDPCDWHSGQRGDLRDQPGLEGHPRHLYHTG